MNKLAFLAASALVCAISAPAHAAVFYATGTFEDGSVLTGTLDIDTVAGRVTSSNVTTTGPTSASFRNIASQASDYPVSGVYFVGTRNAASTLDLNLVLPVQNLIGFNGGTFCSVAADCSRYVSGFYDLANNRGVAFLTAGSLSLTAPVPEPAAWAVMVGGFGMIGGALRRRARTRVRFA